MPSLPGDTPPCWQLFTRAGARGRHLEAAIDLKAELETALRRSQELDIEPEGPRRREVSGVRAGGAAKSLALAQPCKQRGWALVHSGSFLTRPWR